ncbi:hypothetical protein B0J17DRAFT_707156 [Rhizoctonia solani]|nr:hypothetical protein B0J17DRAFT_707156 [Rhizoctonia solani]
MTIASISAFYALCGVPSLGGYQFRDAGIAQITKRSQNLSQNPRQASRPTPHVIQKAFHKAIPSDSVRLNSMATAFHLIERLDMRSGYVDVLVLTQYNGLKTTITLNVWMKCSVSAAISPSQFIAVKRAHVGSLNIIRLLWVTDRHAFISHGTRPANAPQAARWNPKVRIVRIPESAPFMRTLGKIRRMHLESRSWRLHADPWQNSHQESDYPPLWALQTLDNTRGKLRVGMFDTHDVSYSGEPSLKFPIPRSPEIGSLEFVSEKSFLVSILDGDSILVFRHQVGNNIALDFSEDGWMQNQSNESVIWVPPEIRDRFPASSGSDFKEDSSITISYDGMLIGTDWSQCYVGDTCAC